MFGRGLGEVPPPHINHAPTPDPGGKSFGHYLPQFWWGGGGVKALDITYPSSGGGVKALDITYPSSGGGGGVKALGITYTSSGGG